MRPHYTIGLALILVSMSAFSMTAFNGDSAGRKLADMPEPKVDDNDVKALYEACVSYAEAKDPQGNLYFAFSRRLLKHVDTRTSDLNIAKKDAYHQIALEWLRNNQAKLNDRDEETVLHACFYVKAMLGANTGLPTEALAKITKVACYRLVKWLQANTAVANGVQTVLTMIE